MSEETPNMQEVRLSKSDRALFITTIVLIAVMYITMIAAIWTGYAQPVSNDVDPTVSTPETIATEATTECTTVPSDPISATESNSVAIDILPTTEETIHIEEPTPTSEAPRAPVSDENNTSNGMSELEMLACVIYQEVGGDGSCDACRRRVADVVLNRVASDKFPNTIEGVLTAKSQYGSFYWTGVKWADRHTNPGEQHAVERAWRIAEEVMNGQHSELYGNGYVWQAGFVQGSDGFWCCGHWFGR